MRRLIITGSVWIVLLCVLVLFRGSMGETAANNTMFVVILITVFQLFCLFLNSVGVTDKDIADWIRNAW